MNPIIPKNPGSKNRVLVSPNPAFQHSIIPAPQSIGFDILLTGRHTSPIIAAQKFKLFEF
jgi:hypothetical protein